MEYDSYLMKFHGVLLSLSKKGLLNKPPDGSQTEEEIRKCNTEELLNFMASLPSAAKCKIAYYMVLNTELRVSDDLKNDEFIGLFVTLTPAITVQALVKWIDILSLFNEFCKVIENSPFFLGEELLNAVLEAPSLMNKTVFTLIVWCSVFKKICKIEKKVYSESTVTLMNYFKILSSKVEEHLDLSDASYKQLCVLLEFMMTVLGLVSYYKNPDPDDEMYKLSIQFESTSIVEVSSEKCINFLFKTISNILNTLNFEKWNGSLSSFEEWNTVRNLSDRLLNEIKFLEGPGDVLNKLSKLAIKESNTVIESLVLDAKSGRKFDWTRSIINSNVPKSSECLLYKMNDEDLDALLHQAFEYLETSGEEVKELFLAALILSHNQQKWLRIFFDKYQPSLLTTTNTKKDLIETFNKISSTENIPLNIIIPLCMQSPVETIKKLCRLFISSRVTNVMVFHELKPACQVMLPTGVTLLDDVIMCLLSEELTSAEEGSFHRFIVQLKKENFLNCAILKNLIKRLKEFLENNKMSKAVFCLTVIDSILLEMESVNEVALLVFISQVLGYFSWDLNTFSNVKANGRDAVYSIVGRLMARLDCHAESEILNRAREEILKSWEVNQACFCDLWFKFGKTWHGSGRFDSLILALIHSSCTRSDLRQFFLTVGAPEEIRTSIVIALIKILPVLTLNLWCRTLTELTGVWAEVSPPRASSTSYEVFQMFLLVWYLLTLQLNKDNGIRFCYEHCTAGFGRLFTCVRFEGDSLVRIHEKILFIMKSIQDKEIRKSCYVILLPVLKDRLSSASTEEMSSLVQNGEVFE